ncbi:MAG: hypothetical protein ACR2K1_08305 [Saprospiraceae bacterium]
MLHIDLWNVMGGFNFAPFKIKASVLQLPNDVVLFKHDWSACKINAVLTFEIFACFFVNGWLSVCFAKKLKHV